MGAIRTRVATKVSKDFLELNAKWKMIRWRLKLSRAFNRVGTYSNRHSWTMKNRNKKRIINCSIISHSGGKCYLWGPRSCTAVCCCHCALLSSWKRSMSCTENGDILDFQAKCESDPWTHLVAAAVFWRSSIIKLLVSFDTSSIFNEDVFVTVRLLLLLYLSTSRSRTDVGMMTDDFMGVSS